MVARYVQDGDRWQIEQGDYQRSGVGEPDRLPKELTPYRPLSQADLDRLREQWPEAGISERQEGDTRIVQFRFDASAEEAKQFEQLFGVPLSHRLWEFVFDRSDGLVHAQTASQVDTDGVSHLQRRNQLVSWEELPTTALDDSRFAFEDAPSTRSVIPNEMLAALPLSKLYSKQ